MYFNDTHSIHAKSSTQRVLRGPAYNRGHARESSAAAGQPARPETEARVRRGQGPLRAMRGRNVPDARRVAVPKLPVQDGLLRMVSRVDAGLSLILP